jgi:hypothetical protein
VNPASLRLDCAPESVRAPGQVGPPVGRLATGTARALGAIHCALEVTVDLLAITVLGIKFSGTLALEIGVVVLIVIGLVWFTTMRQRRR